MKFHKKKSILYNLLPILLIQIGLSQSTISNTTFETSGGYTTSITEYTDNSEDYFIRTDGSNISSGISFSNVQGSYFFAAQDIDSEGASLPVTLIIDDVDISGYSSLQLKVYIAEDDDGSSQDWDAADYLLIDYDIDNTGSFSNGIHIQSSGSSNSAPAVDTNFDGTGNGTEITNTFTQFSTNISKSFFSR